jgi:hypothetical protein
MKKYFKYFVLLFLLILPLEVFPVNINYYNQGLKFFNELLSGKSIEQIYINETNFYGFNIDLRIPTTNNMKNEIAISSAMYGNLKNYSIAFAGNPCFTILDLFSN